MATLAFVHGLSVLEIDEVQNLATSKGANVNSLFAFFLCCATCSVFR